MATERKYSTITGLLLWCGALLASGCMGRPVPLGPTTTVETLGPNTTGSAVQAERQQLPLFKRPAAAAVPAAPAADAIMKLRLLRESSIVCASLD